MLLSPEQFQLHASLSSSSESPPGSEPFPSPRASWNPLLPPVTASGHVHSVCGGGGRGSHGSRASTPPHTSLDPGATLWRVRGSRGLALLCPPLALAAPNTCQPPSEGRAQPQPRRGLFLRNRWQLRGLEIGARGQPRRLCPETQDGGRGAAGQLPARASARPALLRVPVGPQAARVPLSFWGSLRGTRRGGRRAQGGCSGQGRHGTAKRRPAGPAAPPSAGEGGNSL